MRKRGFLGGTPDEFSSIIIEIKKSRIEMILLFFIFKSGIYTFDKGVTELFIQSFMKPGGQFVHKPVAAGCLLA